MRRIAVICGRSPIPDETFVRRSIAAMRAEGIDVRVFGLNETGFGLMPLAEIFRRIRRPRQLFALLRRMRCVRAVVDFVGSDGLIIAEFAWITADIASLASKISKVPWVCHVHAWDVFTRSANELFRRLETAREVTACSRLAATAVIEAGIAPARVRVEYHKPDEELIALVREKLHRRGAPSAEGLRLVVAVGRLDRKKGFDVLLKAWPLVTSCVPEAELRIVGDGPERGRLNAIARADSVKNVRFLGRLGEFDTLMEIGAASLLVLPSRIMPNGDRDGIANVIREAVALGVRTVTTNAGAASELNSPLVETLESAVSAEDLARAIVDVLLKYCSEAH